MVPGRDRAAAAFFSAAAKRTNGRAVAMRSAANLADVVIGASLEEMDLDALLPRIQEITEELRASDATVSDADVRKSVFERLSKTTKSRPGSRGRDDFRETLTGKTTPHFVGRGGPSSTQPSRTTTS